MGLSSKEVSSDGLGWSQSLMQAPKAMKRRHPQHQQQSEAETLKCPRCDSTNTKFCYYNNYNKAQPRHFCKACKRHWTKGGTLRNVPVGGGHKNKRVKISNTNTASGVTTTKTSIAVKSSTASAVNNRLSHFMAIQRSQQQRQDLQLPLADQKNTSSMQFQVMSRPVSPLSSLLKNHLNCSNLDSKSFGTSNGAFLGSTRTAPSLPPTRGLQFPFSSSNSSSFETTPSSISSSFQSPSIYTYTGETMEDPDPTSTSNIMPTPNATVSHTWEVPITSSDMDIPNYWNWDGMDALVSTDLNMPWDDSEIKP